MHRVLTTPPGRAAWPVLQDDSLRFQLGADAIGIGKSALLAGHRTRRDALLDEPGLGIVIVAAQPFIRRLVKQSHKATTHPKHFLARRVLPHYLRA